MDRRGRGSPWALPIHLVDSTSDNIELFRLQTSTRNTRPYRGLSEKRFEPRRNYAFPTP